MMKEIKPRNKSADWQPLSPLPDVRNSSKQNYQKFFAIFVFSARKAEFELRWNLKNS